MSPLDAQQHTPSATPRSSNPADEQEEEQEVPLTTDAIRVLNGGLESPACIATLSS